MRADNVAATMTSRVLANVQILTWLPSDGGRINVTDKHIIGVSVWVNDPGDDRYKSEDRGGEQAVAIAKRRLMTNGVECLAVMGVQISDLRESTIVNQPKGVGAGVGDFDEPDLGLRSV